MMESQRVSKSLWWNKPFYLLKKIDILLESPIESFLKGKSQECSKLIL